MKLKCGQCLNIASSSSNRVFATHREIITRNQNSKESMGNSPCARNQIKMFCTSEGTCIPRYSNDRSDLFIFEFDVAVLDS